MTFIDDVAISAAERVARAAGPRAGLVAFHVWCWKLVADFRDDRNRHGDGHGNRNCAPH